MLEQFQVQKNPVTTKLYLVQPTSDLNFQFATLRNQLDKHNFVYQNVIGLQDAANLVQQRVPDTKNLIIVNSSNLNQSSGFSNLSVPSSSSNQLFFYPYKHGMGQNFLPNPMAAISTISQRTGISANQISLRSVKKDLYRQPTRNQSLQFYRRYLVMHPRSNTNIGYNNLFNILSTYRPNIIPINRENDIRNYQNDRSLLILEKEAFDSVRKFINENRMDNNMHLAVYGGQAGRNGVRDGKIMDYVKGGFQANQRGKNLAIYTDNGEEILDYVMESGLNLPGAKEKLRLSYQTSNLGLLGSTSTEKKLQGTSQDQNQIFIQSKMSDPQINAQMINSNANNGVIPIASKKIQKIGGRTNKNINQKIDPINQNQMFKQINSQQQINLKNQIINPNVANVANVAGSKQKHWYIGPDKNSIQMSNGAQPRFLIGSSKQILDYGSNNNINTNMDINTSQSISTSNNNMQSNRTLNSNPQIVGSPTFNPGSARGVMHWLIYPDFSRKYGANDERFLFTTQSQSTNMKYLNLPPGYVQPLSVTNIDINNGVGAEVGNPIIIRPEKARMHWFVYPRSNRRLGSVGATGAVGSSSDLEIPDFFIINQEENKEFKKNGGFSQNSIPGVQQTQSVQSIGSAKQSSSQPSQPLIPSNGFILEDRTNQRPIMHWIIYPQKGKASFITSSKNPYFATINRTIGSQQPSQDTPSFRPSITPNTQQKIQQKYMNRKSGLNQIRQSSAQYHGSHMSLYNDQSNVRGKRNSFQTINNITNPIQQQNIISPVPYQQPKRIKKPIATTPDTYYMDQTKQIRQHQQIKRCSNINSNPVTYSIQNKPSSPINTIYDMPAPTHVNINTNTNTINRNNNNTNTVNTHNIHTIHNTYTTNTNINTNTNTNTITRNTNISAYPNVVNNTDHHFINNAINSKFGNEGHREVREVRDIANGKQPSSYYALNQNMYQVVVDERGNRLYRLRRDYLQNMPTSPYQHSNTAQRYKSAPKLQPKPASPFHHNSYNYNSAAYYQKTPINDTTTQQITRTQTHAYTHTQATKPVLPSTEYQSIDYDKYVTTWDKINREQLEEKFDDKGNRYYILRGPKINNNTNVNGNTNVRKSRVVENVGNTDIVTTTYQQTSKYNSPMPLITSPTLSSPTLDYLNKFNDYQSLGYPNPLKTPQTPQIRSTHKSRVAQPSSRINSSKTSRQSLQVQSHHHHGNPLSVSHKRIQSLSQLHRYEKQYKNINTKDNYFHIIVDENMNAYGDSLSSIVGDQRDRVQWVKGEQEIYGVMERKPLPNQFYDVGLVIAAYPGMHARITQGYYMVDIDPSYPIIDIKKQRKQINLSSAQNLPLLKKLLIESLTQNHIFYPRNPNPQTSQLLHLFPHKKFQKNKYLTEQQLEHLINLQLKNRSMKAYGNGNGERLVKIIVFAQPSNIEKVQRITEGWGDRVKVICVGTRRKGSKRGHKGRDSRVVYVGDTGFASYGSVLGYNGGSRISQGNREYASVDKYDIRKSRQYQGIADKYQNNSDPYSAYFTPNDIRFQYPTQPQGPALSSSCPVATIYIQHPHKNLEQLINSRHPNKYNIKYFKSASQIKQHSKQNYILLHDQADNIGSAYNRNMGTIILLGGDRSRDRVPEAIGVRDVGELLDAVL